MTFARGKNPNSQAILLKGRQAAKQRYSYKVLARMIHRMQVGKFTISALAKYAGVSRNSATRWTHANYAAGNVHIAEYLRTLNYRIGARVYQWGSGDDAAKPKPMTRAEIQRRHRAKGRSLDGWRGVRVATEEQRTT